MKPPPSGGFNLLRYGAGFSQLEQANLPGEHEAAGGGMAAPTHALPTHTLPSASHSLPKSEAYWSGTSFGPVQRGGDRLAGASASAGWAVDSGTGQLLSDGAFRLQGDSRAMFGASSADYKESVKIEGHGMGEDVFVSSLHRELDEDQSVMKNFS